MALSVTMADYLRLKDEVKCLLEAKRNAKIALHKALTKNVREKGFVITQMRGLNFLVLKRPTWRTGRRVIVISKAIHFAARAIKAKIWPSGRSFKKYTTKFEASRSAARRYKKAQSSLYNFELKLFNSPVIVATADEADMLAKFTKTRSNAKTTISVVLPPTASEEVVSTLITMASAQGFTELRMHLPPIGCRI